MATGWRWTAAWCGCARRPEPLLEIHAHDAGELVRIAWHLGNRHLPVQLLGERIRIRADHVIGEMVEGLGGHVDAIEAPFDPEAGAYAGGHHHHHDDDRSAMPPIRVGGQAAACGRICCGCSPGCRRRFPTGAYAYSHGWNGRWKRGDVTDGDTLRAWLADVLMHGSGRNDAILLRHAHRDRRRPRSAERARRRHRAVARAAHRDARSRHRVHRRRRGMASAGTCRSASRTRLRSARSPAGMASTKTQPTAAYLQAFTANLISAAVRLVPLGQTAGLRVLAALEPIILRVAAESRAATLDDLGGCAFRSDLASMRHETQYTRLFRS